MLKRISSLSTSANFATYLAQMKTAIFLKDPAWRWFQLTVLEISVSAGDDIFKVLQDLPSVPADIHITKCLQIYKLDKKIYRAK